MAESGRQSELEAGGARETLLDVVLEKFQKSGKVCEPASCWPTLCTVRALQR